MIFISGFCPTDKYSYILIDTVAAVKEQVVTAVDVTTFLLLIGSFLLDLFSISEAVIFTDFPLPYQKPRVAPRATGFFLLLLTTKLINKHTFWRT